VSPGDASIVRESSFWDARYAGGTARWDLGGPTPVIGELVDGGTLRPCRVLVPGCGLGHDAIFLARRGYDVVAVDFSAEAIRRAGRAARAAGVTIQFLQRDLFTLSPEFDGAFGAIVEYVTYCAVDPAMRPALASLFTALLASEGTLAALFFPVEDRNGGPPFGVSMEEVRTLFGRHLMLEMSGEHPATIGPRKGREVLTLWKKNRESPGGDRMSA
jgi:SAM-dependent methyltransferase